VILKSDAEFDHLCWMEGDATLERYQLEPEPLLVHTEGQTQRTQFDVLVTLRDGSVQLRDVKEAEDASNVREQHEREARAHCARTAGFDFVRITRTQLDEQRQLILNWRRALSFLAACRDLPLESYRLEIAAALQRQPHCTLEDVLSGTSEALRPLYLAAVFKSLQAGWLASDLAVKPLCMHSTVWLSETSHA
jgi:hypothetical protein